METYLLLKFAAKFIMESGETFDEIILYTDDDLHVDFDNESYNVVLKQHKDIEFEHDVSKKKLIIWHDIDYLSDEKRKIFHMSLSRCRMYTQIILCCNSLRDVHQTVHQLTWYYVMAKYDIRNRDVIRKKIWFKDTEKIYKVMRECMEGEDNYCIVSAKTPFCNESIRKNFGEYIKME